MVRCEYNEETNEMAIEAYGAFAVVELMFLMENVSKEIGKQTSTDWKVQLHNMAQVVLGDEMTLEDIAKAAAATMNNIKYGATDPE